MRKQEERTYALAALHFKGDRMSLIMADVLKSCMTEQQVFQKYVLECPEDGKEETVFFAARDAARYLAGRIGLEELIPDIESLPIEKPVKQTYVSIPQKEFREMQITLRRLEEKINMLCDIKTKETVREDELMTKKEAARYVGCGERTIDKWSKLGLIKSHCVKIRLYYIKSELDASPVVQNFLKNKKE